MSELRHIPSPCVDAVGPAEYKLLNWKKLTPDKDGVIYWHVANFTDKMDKFKVLFAFQTCFEKWQEAFDQIEPVGRVIELRSTDDWYQAHIRLYFLNPGETERDIVISDGTTVTVRNRWPFDGPQGVLAHRPPNSFDLHFDEGEAWSEIHKFCKDTNTLFVQLWQVAMHELGHILDIAHSDKEDAIMYPTYDGVHTTITQDDLDGLAASFGEIKRETKARIAPAQIVTELVIKRLQDTLPRGNVPYRKRRVEQITQIIVHHTADNGTPESVANYHVNQKGWPGIGYHFMIDKSGQIFQTNDIDTVSYHVANMNTISLGVTCIGNFEIEEPTPAQIESLIFVIKAAKAIIGDVPVYGHRDKGETLCPGKNLYKLIQNKDVS